MADQSIGTGKFAGLLLLLQGLLVILFVVFVGYSDDLLTELPEQAEHGTKIESNYSGKRYRLPNCEFVEGPIFRVSVTIMFHMGSQWKDLSQCPCIIIKQSSFIKLKLIFI